MKTCPTCKAHCFDDMGICYGCMHQFDIAAPEGMIPGPAGRIGLPAAWQADPNGSVLRAAKPPDFEEPYVEQGGIDRLCPAKKQQPRHAASVSERNEPRSRHFTGEQVAESPNMIRLPVIAEGEAIGKEGFQAAYHLVVSLEPAH